MADQLFVTEVSELSNSKLAAIEKSGLDCIIHAAAMESSRQRTLASGIVRLADSGQRAWEPFWKQFLRYQRMGGLEHITYFWEMLALAGYSGKLRISEHDMKKKSDTEIIELISDDHNKHLINYLLQSLDGALQKVDGDPEQARRLMDQFQLWYQSTTIGDFPVSELIAVFISKFPVDLQARLMIFLGGRHNLPKHEITFTTKFYEWVRLEEYSSSLGSTTGALFSGANAVIAGDVNAMKKVESGGGGGDAAREVRRMYCFVHGYQLSHTGKTCRSATITPAQRAVITANRGVVDGVMASKASAGRVGVEENCVVLSSVINQSKHATLSSAPITSKRRGGSRVVPNREQIDALLDSGATHLLVTDRDKHKLSDVRPGGGCNMRLANGTQITSTSTAVVRFGAGIEIPAHVFSAADLKHNLTPIAPFTNLGCVATLTATGATITKDGVVVVEGTKRPDELLWRVKLPVQVSAGETAYADLQWGSVNLAISNQLDADFVQFAVATFGSPLDWALLRALNRNYLGNFPRLTAKMLAANRPAATATAMGHLDATRKGLRSTKEGQTSTAPRLLSLDDEDEGDEVDDERLIFTRLLAAKDVLHSDATGQMPVQSRRGTQYVLVSVWNNYIHMERLSSRSKGEYKRAFEATYEFFRARGVHPNVQRLDNETSGEVERQFTKAGVKIDFVAPGDHRANRAERGIRDAKNHLISVFCTADPSYPVNELDRFFEQAELTLNHLRPYGPQHSLSAYEGLHKQKYDFLAHPIAPCGTRVLVFEAPEKRGSWAGHGVHGFYLGPAKDTYRSFRTLVSETKSERVSNTLAWFPKHFMMPGSSPLELVIAAIKDLTTAMTRLGKVPPGVGEQKQLLVESATQLQTSLRDLAALYDDGNSLPKGDVKVIEQQEKERVPEEQRVVSKAQPAEMQPVQEAQPQISQSLPIPSHPAGVSGSGVTTPSAPKGRGGKRKKRNEKEVGVQSSPQQRVGEEEELRPPPGFVGPAPNADKPNVMLQAPVQRTKPARKQRAAQPTHRVTRQGTAQGLGLSAVVVPEGVTIPSVFSADKYSKQRRQTRNRRARGQRGGRAFQAQIALREGKERALNLTEDGKPLTYQRAIAGPDKDEWERADDEEFDRTLATTMSMFPIMPSDQPKDRRKDTTYYNRVCAEKPPLLPGGKSVKRVRGTLGGDQINYPGEVSAHTADMSEVKILLNAVVSEGAMWTTLDISDFYLGTDLERPEYVKIKASSISARTMAKYGLDKFVVDGYVLFQVVKGMYGLPQAGLLAQKKLIAHLGANGYKPGPNTPCLFRHETRSTAFSLVVDDFGVKHATKADAEHLIEVLRQVYKIKVDWSGAKYLGYKIRFSADRRSVALSMPDYLPRVHQRFPERFKRLDGRGAASPEIYTAPAYGAHSQMTEIDDTPPLGPEALKELQEFTGCFMFYARAVDGTMLTAVNHTAAELAEPTQRTDEMVQRLLAYSLEYPNNELVFTASDMVLHIQTDASYLSRSKARSVVGGLEYLGNKDQPTHINGAVHTFSSILDVVVASAGEAEYGGLFTGAKHGEASRAVLEFLGYPQPATIILGDSACATGIANDTVKVKRTKSIDMRYHWVRDRVRQGHFDVQWRKGAHNLADFFTKALPVHKHQELMPLLVQVPKDRHAGMQVRTARRTR